MSVDFDTALAIAAADVRRRFYGHVERDDLVQIGWVWKYEHPGTFTGYDTDEDEKRAGYRLRRDLMMCLEKYARKQRAENLRYGPDDEAFYSETLIGAILPSILFADYDAPQAQSDGRGSSDPAESGTWMAHRQDVERAWREAPLQERERDALILYYGFGKTQAEIASMVGVLDQRISERIRSGMRKLIAALGGDKPSGCPYDCECHEGKLRMRPGIHSEISGKNQEMR